MELDPMRMNKMISFMLFTRKMVKRLFARLTHSVYYDTCFAGEAAYQALQSCTDNVHGDDVYMVLMVEY